MPEKVARETGRGDQVVAQAAQGGGALEPLVVVPLGPFETLARRAGGGAEGVKHLATNGSLRPAGRVDDEVKPFRGENRCRGGFVSVAAAAKRAAESAKRPARRVSHLRGLIGGGGEDAALVKYLG